MRTLMQRIKVKEAPISVRLCASIYTIPPEILEVEFAKRWRTPNAVKEAAIKYSKICIDAVKDLVPAVTLPTNYFTLYGSDGMDALIRISQYAQEQGLSVIEDCNITAENADEIDGILEHRLGMPSVDKLKQRVFFNDFITMNPWSNPDIISHAAIFSKRENKTVLLTIRPNDDPGMYDTDVSIVGYANPSAPMYFKLCHTINKVNIVNEDGFSVIGVSAAFKENSTEFKRIRMEFPNLFIHARGYKNLSSIAGALKHEGAIADTDIPFTAFKNPSYAGMSIEKAIKESTKEIIMNIKKEI